MANVAFSLHDCSLVRSALGRSCTNLRELLDALRTAPLAVIEHHLVRCALDDHFEMYEFPNDLARWCWDALGERQLAEELALVNPYTIGDLEALRGVILNLLEDHLWTLDRAPWCRQGLELHLVASRLISFDTGERISSVAGLAEALPSISLRSLFFHFHEAHQRSGTDDFSRWLEAIDAPAEMVTRIRNLDFYFLNLSQLRERVLDELRAHMASHHGHLRATR